MDNVRLDTANASMVQMDGDTANVFIVQEISGWYGYGKRDLMLALKGGKAKRVNMYINSPGGGLEDALAMYDMIRGSQGIEVTAYLFGQCASAATVVASAAHRVVISKQCLYLVHKPLLSQFGNADDMRKSAAELDVWEGVVIDLFARKTGMDKEAIAGLMREDAWMNAETAVALGFADELADNIEINWDYPELKGEQYGGFWDYGYWNESTDGKGVMNGGASYRNAIYNSTVNKGQRPITTVAMDAFNNNKTGDMAFFKTIIDKLAAAGIISGSGIEQAQGIAEQAEQEAVDAVAEAVLAKLQNNGQDGAEAVFNVFNSLTEEQAREVRAKIGVPDNSAQVDELKATVTTLADAVASLRAPGRQSAPPQGNGKPDNLQNKAGDGANFGNWKPAQVSNLLTAVAQGNLSREDFKRTTGMDVEAAKDALAELR